MHHKEFFEIVLIGVNADGVVIDKCRPGKLYESIGAARQAARKRAASLTTSTVSYMFYLERAFVI